MKSSLPPLPVYDDYYRFCTKRDDFYCLLCNKYSREGTHEINNILHWMRLEHPFDYVTDKSLQDARARELEEWIKKHSAPVAQVNE